MTASEIYNAVNRIIKSGVDVSVGVCGECRDLADGLFCLYMKTNDCNKKKVAQILDGTLFTLPDPTEHVTVKKAAKMMGISERTVIRMMKNGTLKVAHKAPTDKHPDGQRYLVGASIREYLRPFAAGGVVSVRTQKGGLSK